MPQTAAARIQATGMQGSAGGFSVELGGYCGHEDEILRLRNANRSVVQTRDFLDWRYRTLPELPPPRIAWLRDPSGRAVGMAAAIYRRFWIDGVACPVGVLGDISLDERLRGQGLGQQLLAGLSRELQHAEGGGRGFVIPTEAARRSLAALGWRDAGQLIPYVCLVDPAAHLARRVGSAGLADLLALPFRGVLSLAARLQRRRDWSIELADDFDERFDALWSSFPKTGLILGDRSRAALRWRYHDHPNRRFRVARFLHAGEMRGYVVFETTQDGSDLSVQDMLVVGQRDLPCVLAVFLSWCLAQHWLGTVRVALSQGHPYAAGLWRLGFVAREPQARFQVLEAAVQAAPPAGAWSLTAGDKDI